MTINEIQCYAKTDVIKFKYLRRFHVNCSGVGDPYLLWMPARFKQDVRCSKKICSLFKLFGTFSYKLNKSYIFLPNVCTKLKLKFVKVTISKQLLIQQTFKNSASFMLNTEAIIYPDQNGWSKKYSYSSEFIVCSNYWKM